MELSFGKYTWNIKSSVMFSVTDLKVNFDDDDVDDKILSTSQDYDSILQFYLHDAVYLYVIQDYLPVWCCLPVPACAQSDCRWRLWGRGGLKRSPHLQQDHWTAVCRYDFKQGFTRL